LKKPPSAAEDDETTEDASSSTSFAPTTTTSPIPILKQTTTKQILSVAGEFDCEHCHPQGAQCVEGKCQCMIGWIGDGKVLAFIKKKACF
jgi:hypothetical protein